MVETYILYHSTKQQSTRADPLAEILNNITKNPATYANVQTPNLNNIPGQSDKKQNKEEKDKEQYTSKATNSSRQSCTCVTRDNETIIHDGDIKTRLEHISREPDRLAHK